MTPIGPDEKRRIIFNAITAARLSNWVYEDTDHNFPSSPPPIDQRVDAIIHLGDEDTDTQGCAIVTPNRIMFVFRGSESTQDWLNNVKALKCDMFGIKIHRGFAGAAWSVLAEVGEVLDIYPDRQIVSFAGHSLGGAIATALCVAINAQQGDRTLSLTTVGQPRVSTKGQLDRALDGVEYIRIQNGSDIVVGIPRFTYSHAGLNVYLPNNVRDVKGKASTIDDLVWFSPTGWQKFRDRAFTFKQRGTDHSSKGYINSLVRAAT